MQVINSKQEITTFKPKVLKEYLLDNTELSDDECRKIADAVKNQVYKQFDKEITTSVLKSLILSTLIKRGEIKEVKNNTILGLTVNEFYDLNYKGCKDNANLSYSPSQVEKYTYDAVAKKYALEIMPERSKQMYIDGFIHHHDLESYANKPNCFNVDLRFLGRNGLKIDGKGDVGAVASPAKSLKVILNHMLQLWMSLSQVFSGGLGYVNFNTLLAPYIKGMEYEDIYQELEGFIYNCNMSLVSKGGQIIFSSIGLDLSIPEVLADKEACLPGGVYNGSKYKDYKREADIIFEIICKIIDKKDSSGSPFRFPNILFNIRKGDIDEYKGNCKLLHELGANNPTIYYVNCVEEEKTVMGCRTSNICNYTGDYEKDCMNTGNFMYSTINLPLIQLSTNSDEEFYELLDECCEVVYETLKHRRQTIIDIHKNGIAPILQWKDKDTGLPLYNIDYTSLSIGYCGLNECLLQSDNSLDGEEIIRFINDKKNEFHNRDNLRWAVIGSPAESTAWKFAKINKEKYPDKAIVNGGGDKVYLTNSHHISVGHNGNIAEHIKNSFIYHPLSAGGCILHVWLAEAWSIPEAIHKLNQKIIKGGTQFWAYSKVFTYCRNCGFTINEEMDTCYRCKSTDVRKYDRCFSGDTNIFIKNNENDKIKIVTLKDFYDNYNWENYSTINYDDTGFNWSKIVNAVKNPKEKLYKVKLHKGFEFKATSDHEFYKHDSAYDVRKMKYKTIPVNKLEKGSRLVNHRCLNVVPENIYEDKVGTFVGFVLGDGSVHYNKNCGIRLKFYKKEKSDYCKKLLDELSLKYSYSEIIEKRDNCVSFSYYIGSDNCGNKAYDIFNNLKDKCEVINYDYSWNELLGIFAGLINSDSSVLIGRKNGIVTTFNQVNTKILYFFYYISMLLGNAPSISFTKRKKYDDLGRIEITSKKTYELLNKIDLREPFNKNLEKGVCLSDANNILGMNTVKNIELCDEEDSYCITVESETHNALFNGVLAKNCTGYYLPVDTFNDGKIQEFGDRFRHKL